MTTGTSAATGGTFLLALFAETPLHPGTGQSTGVVDLPVQRERHTRFPIIPSTSLKGSLRDLAEQNWDQVVVNQVFGPLARQDVDLHAGALVLTDARLLAFPVRSLSHVFLWVTCPLALGRLRRDLSLAGLEADWPGDTNVNSGELVSAADDLVGTVVLEDLALTARVDATWRTVASRVAEAFLPDSPAHGVHKDKLARHLVLVTDEDFAWLVEHATQVTARIALNDRKTTTGDGGNLWYEETLPADTLLYALVRAEQPRTVNPSLNGAAAVRERLMLLLNGAGSFVQVGGNETVGHGWCAVRVVDGGQGGDDA